MNRKKIIIIITVILAVSWNRVLADENGTWKTIDINNGFYQEKKYVYELENKEYIRGWKEINQEWYYFDEVTGYMIQDDWVENYYLGKNGIMLKDEWIVEKIGTTPNVIAYYVDKNGIWDAKANYKGCEGEWKEDQIGKKYKRVDGTYPISEFEYINNNWYFFNENGYMITGIFYNKETGVLHYFYPDGSLANNVGWLSIEDGKWIYVNGNICVVNAITPDGYYIDETGIWSE